MVWQGSSQNISNTGIIQVVETLDRAGVISRPFYMHPSNMQRYKHYSFDLWQTLIRSNLAFKKSRAEYMALHFNPLHLSEREVQTIISEIAAMCDSVSECTEMSIHPIQMYSMLLFRLGFDKTNLTQMDMLSILNVMQARFLKDPPWVYDNDTRYVFRKLKQEGATISITSNTGFVPGSTLKQYLTDAGLAEWIDFYLFSDEIGVSKPSRVIFNKMSSIAQQCASLNGRGNWLQLDDIVHIGDNFKTDIQGARTAGITAIQVHGATGLTLKSLI